MMLEQIEELLNDDAPALADVESTLTDGYAQALALESERLQLERRLGQVARAGGDGAGEELTSIGRQLNTTDGELAALRRMLGVLHERARRLRRTKP
jgi:hypothetical protein